MVPLAIALSQAVLQYNHWWFSSIHTSVRSIAPPKESGRRHSPALPYAGAVEWYATMVLAPAHSPALAIAAASLKSALESMVISSVSPDLTLRISLTVLCAETASSSSSS